MNALAINDFYGENTNDLLESTPTARRSSSRARTFRPRHLHPVTDDPTLLVYQARAGNAAAVDAIYNQYLPYVRQICRRFFLPGASREDLLQEGAMGLHHAITTYSADKGQRFDDYVSMWVRNYVMHAVRQATRQKHMLLTRAASIEVTVEVGSYRSARLGPDEEAIGTLALEDWKELIRTHLSELEQAVLAARMNGQDADDTVRMLGVGRKQLENALFRARKKLAQAAILADLLEGTLSQACRPANRAVD